MVVTFCKYTGHCPGSTSTACPKLTKIPVQLLNLLKSLLAFESTINYVSLPVWITSVDNAVAVEASVCLLMPAIFKPDYQWFCKRSPDIWAWYKHKSYRT